jgi:hypothetical protein
MTPTITRTPTPGSSAVGPRISYIGAISQDGCPFCCEFICATTPTPTPFIDDQGRQVFVHATGQFLFVIEGQIGTSGIAVGNNTMPSGSDRGDVQVLVSQRTGNGSALKCDMGPPPIPFGGVPGVNPPLFGPGQSITDAIQDMACRFTIQTESRFACTRTRSGDFGFVSCTGQLCAKQFCYQVPLSGAFSIGDNVVGAQLRDLAGNLGPKKEIVIRVLP